MIPDDGGETNFPVNGELTMRTSLLVAMALLLLAATAVSGPEEEKPRAIRLQVPGGGTVEADWYPCGDGMPAVVFMGIEGQGRETWGKLAGLRPGGFGFLALPLPGGDEPAVRIRAAADALRSGVAWLRKEGGGDPRRIAAMGIGAAAVAVLRVAKEDDLLAGAWLLGVHAAGRGLGVEDLLAGWKGRPLLVARVEEDASAGAEEFWKDRPEVPGRETVFLEPLSQAEVVEAMVAGEFSGSVAEWWYAAAGRQILDGKVDAWEAREFEGERGMVGKERSDSSGRLPASGRIRWDDRSVSFHLKSPSIPVATNWFSLGISGHSWSGRNLRLMGKTERGGAVYSMELEIPTHGAVGETTHPTRRPVKDGELELRREGDFLEVRVPLELLGLDSDDTVSFTLDGSPKPGDSGRLVEGVLRIP